MENELGERIHRSRVKQNLTQSEYAAKYDVSGPAIFKFEKGYARPSLELWLEMAKDEKIPKPQAVLLWLKSKLPKRYQSYVGAASKHANRKEKRGKPRKKAIFDDAVLDDWRLKVEEVAARIGVAPDELARAVIRSWIAQPDDAFLRAANYVLKKYAELYRRLA